MKKKHTYRTTDVQKVSFVRLLETLKDEKVIIGVDVAKTRQVASVCNGQGIKELLVHFDHPMQTGLFFGLLAELRRGGKQVELVTEPTGTYGDALCHQAHEQGIEVYQINPARSHAMAEALDGVHSFHDAKDATVIARLHAQEATSRWRPAPEMQRELRALVAQREVYQRQEEVCQGQLEALLARHWPEGQQVLNLRTQRSTLELLRRAPSPEAIVALGEVQVRMQLRWLKGDAVQKLWDAARQSSGVPMLPQEAELVRTLVGEVLRAQEAKKQLEEKIQEHTQRQDATRRVAALVGPTTAAVLVGHLGPLGAYHSPKALEKAMGLNLKEASSGRDRFKQQRPGVHLSKRGPGEVRKYWYLATLRWLQVDWIARAWYQQRSAYHEERGKGRAVVALMRKLVRALWHSSRGATYDPERLFDVRRLPAAKAQDAGQVEVTM